MQTAKNDSVFYLFLFSEEVYQSWKILYKSSSNSKAFIVVEVEVLLSKPILLEEIDRKVMSGIVKEKQCSFSLVTFA